MIPMRSLGSDIDHQQTSYQLSWLFLQQKSFIFFINNPFLFFISSFSPQIIITMALLNANPVVYQTSISNIRVETEKDFDDDVLDPIDSEEVYELLRSISDPEHPLTLEQLNVTQLQHISVDNDNNHVLVEFTPTIPHCSMATLIGLCIRVRLLRSLPERFKVDIKVRKGTHQSENAVNKQLNDKERVAAALENKHLLEVVNQCLATASRDAVAQ
ncbi:hypothetical protein BDA99DRAFT_498176 [Phascolomyces articulosus]|uniref:MIP18 family-like domain-containing protein n=1 Tax=Phascolomyces articulosus TaxID=60185 RepID=A0AAD5K8Y2_9FUNG|nr:hypothetical protein BDA99DRAFT_498176 [Phascolomyces articulosus]